MAISWALSIGRRDDCADVCMAAAAKEPWWLGRKTSNPYMWQPKILDEWSANLTLPDYGRVARHPPGIGRQGFQHGEGSRRNSWRNFVRRQANAEKPPCGKIPDATFALVPRTCTPDRFRLPEVLHKNNVTI